MTHYRPSPKSTVGDFRLYSENEFVVMSCLQNGGDVINFFAFEGVSEASATVSDRMFLRQGGWARSSCTRSKPARTPAILPANPWTPSICELSRTGLSSLNCAPYPESPNTLNVEISLG